MGGHPNVRMAGTELGHWVQPQPLEMDKPELEEECDFSQGSWDCGECPWLLHACPPGPCLPHCSPCLAHSHHAGAGSSCLLSTGCSDFCRVYFPGPVLTSLPPSASLDTFPPRRGSYFLSGEENLFRPMCSDPVRRPYHFWVLRERHEFAKRKVSAVCFVQ